MKTSTPGNLKSKQPKSTTVLSQADIHRMLRDKRNPHKRKTLANKLEELKKLKQREEDKRMHKIQMAINHPDFNSFNSRPLDLED